MLPADRFTTSYSIWGEALNVDRLLAESPPRTIHEVWRRGDHNPLGGGCITSGITVELFCGSSGPELHSAVRRFLTRDAKFLRAARSRTRAGTRSGLTTCVSVGATEEVPAGLELPVSLLRLAAKAGVSWSILASVYRNAEVADQGEAPSNNEMQLTRSATAARRGPRS